MEYIYFLNSNTNFDDVCDNIVNILHDDVFGKTVIISKKDNELDLYCDVFTLSIDPSSNYIRVMQEESNLKLNIELYMDLYTSCDEVIAKTIYFIGKCLKVFNGDAILLSNGDTPILKRTDKDIIVDSSKIQSTETYPFEELNAKYRHERIHLASDKSL